MLESWYSDEGGKQLCPSSHRKDELSDKDGPFCGKAQLLNSYLGGREWYWSTYMMATQAYHA